MLHQMEITLPDLALLSSVSRRFAGLRFTGINQQDSYSAGVSALNQRLVSTTSATVVGASRVCFDHLRTCQARKRRHASASPV